MILLVAILALAQSDAPRTVNGQVIGAADEFRRKGPTRICLETTQILLEADEVSELDYLGIHAGRVRIKSPRGDLLISEGDSWAVPKRSERAFDTHSGYIQRVGGGRKTRYLIFSPSDYSDRPTARVWVEGSAIQGNDNDRKILDRIEVTKGPPKDCDQRFDYGWDYILGE